MALMFFFYSEGKWIFASREDKMCQISTFPVDIYLSDVICDALRQQSEVL